MVKYDSITGMNVAAEFQMNFKNSAFKKGVKRLLKWLLEEQNNVLASVQSGINMVLSMECGDSVWMVTTLERCPSNTCRPAGASSESEFNIS